MVIYFPYNYLHYLGTHRGFISTMASKYRNVFSLQYSAQWNVFCAGTFTLARVANEWTCALCSTAKAHAIQWTVVLPIRSACAFLYPIGSRSYMTTSAPCIAWCIGIRSSVNRLAPPRWLSRTRDSLLSLNRSNYESVKFSRSQLLDLFSIRSIKDIK